MAENLNQLKKFLLIRTDRIGDVVLTLPAASVIKNKIPGAQIFFLTRSYTSPLSENYRDVDRTLIYHPQSLHKGWSGIRKLAQEIASHQFDVAILFYPGFYLAIAIYLAHIPIRVGIGYRWYSFLFNRRHMEHRKYGLKHELEYNLSLLNELFPEPDYQNIQFNFRLKETVERFRNEELKKLNLAANQYAIVHPGSGGSAPNLTVRQYRLIVQYLLKHTDFHILLTGSENEKLLHQQILSNFNSSRIISLPGKYDLEKLMALISGARLFISSSTGPLHIANALGVPVLAFYCPARPCSPTRWGPYHQQKWVVVPQVNPCKSCNPQKCPHGNCIEKIPDEIVQKKLAERLNSLL